MPANGTATLNATPQTLFDRSTDAGDVAAVKVENTGATNPAEINIVELHGSSYASIAAGESEEFIYRKGISKVLAKSTSGTTIKWTSTGG